MSTSGPRMSEKEKKRYFKAIAKAADDGAKSLREFCRTITRLSIKADKFMKKHGNVRRDG